MHLCEITPELQLEILQFCTPRDLASLSRVHTSLSDVAQHALYSHIYFFAHPPDFIPLEDWDSDRNPSKLNKDGSLFHMLSTSARRAAIVKKLHIHFSDGDYWRGATVTTAVNDIMVQVSDTLKKLPNLVDLRIAYDWLGGPSGGRLSETIGGGHFQLHTLWLGEAHDIKGIIANQPNLRFLGVFCIFEERLLTTVKGLVQRASSCTIPTIVILNYGFPTLLIFPSSHRHGQVLGECREIARSISEFPPNFHNFTLAFNFLWSTGEDIGLFIEVMKEMATCFQTYYPHLKVERLSISIHDLTTHWQSWNFPQFTKSLPLPLFETVKDVIFHFPGLKEDEWRLFIADAHLLVRELGKEWSLVQHIRVAPWTIHMRVVR